MVGLVKITDTASRELVSNVLSSRRFTVRATDSTHKAIDLVSTEERIGLVIADITAGEPDRKFLASLKEKQPGITIILISDKQRLSAMAECADVGGDDYLTQPIDIKKVNGVLNRVAANCPPPQEPGLGSGLMTTTTRIISKYRLTRILGKGATGVVYLARDINDDSNSTYALKLLNPPGESSKETTKREILERFLREAETASLLNHPNIVRILDYGLSEEELLPFIVMEYVRGRSLRYYIENNLAVNLLQKIHIICQIAEALQEIHNSNICHRDLKPENIMINEDLFVKVADFGFARLPNSDLTQSLDILGTPCYMSPESYSSSVVDSRADLFALGVIAYEILLDQKPFTAGSLTALMRKIKNECPLGPHRIDPGFPESLQLILAKLLKKDRDSRYQDSKDVLADLKEYIDEALEPPKTAEAAALFDSTEIVGEIDIQYLVSKEYQNNTDWR